ncbi:MAG: dockerin type I domain-containing protein [Chloroflexia bacterium]
MVKNKRHRTSRDLLNEPHTTGRNLLIVLALLSVLALGGAANSGFLGDLAGGSNSPAYSGGASGPLAVWGGRSAEYALQANMPVPGWAIPRAAKPGGALVNQAVLHDVSPPLRSIPPAKGAAGQVGEKNELRIPVNGKPREGIVDPVVQRGFGLSPLAMPTPLANFEGIGNLTGVLPPDTNGDVGPNHYVQWVNLQLQVFSKTGVSLYGPVPGNTLWTGFGGVCEHTNNGDPIAIYDSMADRWVLSQFAVPGGVNGYHQCVAVSTSPDPTGSYYRYDFFQDQNLFTDYPHFGVWPDAYYISFNSFQGTTFFGARAVALDRAQMLVGQQAGQQIFQLTSSPQLPSDLDGPTLPPPGAPNVYASIDIINMQLNFFNFHVDWNNPANSTFVHTATADTAPFIPLCLARTDCIAQPPPPPPTQPALLDGIGSRLMYRIAYRNFGDHESLVLNHSVDTTGTRLAGVRWYEVRSPATNPTIYQQGTYAPDTDSRWMASAAQDHSGNMAVGYSVSSLTTYPSIRYAGRSVSDTLGTLGQGEATLIAGGGSQTSSSNRWGDYSMMSTDPTDDCTFWYTQEYYGTTSDHDWQTRIGSFRFPSCAGTTPTPMATGATQTPTRTVTQQASFTATKTPTITQTPMIPCSTTVITGSITSTDSLQVARLGRDNSPSTCDGKGCPSSLGQGLRHYDQYTFYNDSGQPQCVLVRLDTACDGTTNPIFSAAYLGSYDPTNLCTNYLGDIGFNPPDQHEYSFTVPAGATYVIIVNEVNEDTGCPSYTLTVSCGVFGGTPTATATVTGTPPTATRTFSPTRTATPTATFTPLGCGITQPLIEGFESGTLGAFVATTTIGSEVWAPATDAVHSGTYSAHGIDANEQTDQQMAMRNAVAIPADAQVAELRFWHRFSFEQPGFDGGVLEVSTNGGTIWLDAGTNITQGGYTGVITATGGNPLTGRPAWVNQSPSYPGFNQVVVNLLPYAGQSVKLRYRTGTDLNGVGPGWWVDDVSIFIRQPCGSPSSTPTVTRTPTPGSPTATATPTACGPNSNYVVTQSTGPIVPGTTLVAGSQCNDCLAQIPLPFNVQFYGGTRNFLAAISNGNVQFYCCNSTSQNSCLPARAVDDTIMGYWDDLDMSVDTCGPNCGVYTSVSGILPNRIFNIEYRAKRAYDVGEVNFEISLYEGQHRFDIVYGTVAGGGSGATVGVQKDIGQQYYTQYECNTGGLSDGSLLIFTQQSCPANALVGHVTWQGRPAQPSTLQQLPLTLTLKSALTEIDYPVMTTDASGFFTASVTGLTPGVYTWRVKSAQVGATPPQQNPGWLATSGTATLTGAAVTQQEMGVQRAGDCNNDNVDNSVDFVILKNTFGQSVGQAQYDNRADFTGDTVVNSVDFSLLKANFGQSGAPPVGP